MNDSKPISEFLEQMAIYQSNHYGYYDRSALVNAYENLNPGIKKYLLPQQNKPLWRGCDGLSETRAISFTTNKGIAHLFGAYVIPFKELKSYSGLVDTAQTQKLIDRLGLKFHVGDDEGEVIVIKPVWNESLAANLRQYFVG